MSVAIVIFWYLAIGYFLDRLINEILVTDNGELSEDEIQCGRFALQFAWPLVWGLFAVGAVVYPVACILGGILRSLRYNQLMCQRAARKNALVLAPESW